MGSIIGRPGGGSRPLMSAGQDTVLAGFPAFQNGAAEVPLNVLGWGGCQLSPGHGQDSRRRDCHFDDTPFLALLKHLIKVEGVQQNDSLADG